VKPHDCDFADAFIRHGKLRDSLVAVTLEWERVFGVAPSITSAVSEYDAACLVGHTDESYRAAWRWSNSRDSRLRFYS